MPLDPSIILSAAPPAKPIDFLALAQDRRQADAQRQEGQMRQLAISEAQRKAAAEAQLEQLLGSGVYNADGSPNDAELLKHAQASPQSGALLKTVIPWLQAVHEGASKAAKARSDAAKSAAEAESAQHEVIAHIGATAEQLPVQERAAYLASTLPILDKTGAADHEEVAALMAHLQDGQAPGEPPSPAAANALILRMKNLSKTFNSPEARQHEAETAASQAMTTNRQAELPGVQAEAALKQQITAGSQGGMTPEQQAQAQSRSVNEGLRGREVAATETRTAAELPKIRAEAALAAANAAQTTALNVAPGGAAPNPSLPAGQKDEAFLQSLPAGVGSQVKALAEGRMQFPSGFALRSPYWQNLLQAVAKYDPSFDAVNYNNRAKTRASFTSGKEAGQVNAINTVIGHLDNLSDAADALHNGNIQLFNRLGNAVSKATGSPKVTNFDTIKKAVSDEVTRVWRQAGGSEADVKAAQANLDSAGSPAQLHEAIATYGHLLESKLEALNDQYRQGMGTDKVDMVTPKSQATLQKLEGRAGNQTAAGSVSVTAGGKTYTFPTQDQADAFKKAAGLK